MGWGTEFRPYIYLSKEIYSTKSDIDDRIKELDKKINDCESTLKMHASSTPKDIVPPDFSETQIIWLNDQINQVLDDYQEYLLSRYRLYLYLEFIDDGGEIVKTE